MEKGKLFMGICLLLGLMFIGAMLPKAVNDYRGYDRVVNVKGLCEKEVMADKVIWPLAITVSGDDINMVYKDISSRNAAVKKFLIDGGIPEENITVSGATVSDRNTQSYTSNRLFRYLVKDVVTVCSSDVETVRGLMARQNELLKAGIVLDDENWENQTVFSYESLNDIKPAMIEEATKNAREVALKFASDSGSKLGKIKEANQGTFSISDRDSNTPWVKKVRVVTNVTYYLNK